MSRRKAPSPPCITSCRSRNRKSILPDIRGVIDAALEIAPDNRINNSGKRYDLSGIDFERLRAEFEKSPYKATAILDLQERIQARLDMMLRQNPTRIDLLKRYQDIVAEYNKDKDEAEIQRVFEELIKTHDALDDEAKRYIREGFKDDKALAVFDLLSKDKDAVTKNDLDKIKKVAQELTDVLAEQQKIMGSLRDRASAQAKMKMAIIDQLLADMPAYYSEKDIEVRADELYRYMQQQMQYSLRH
ncbi:MAG: type I restriction enzyme endonuclease domain-containing protein [Methylobacter sp.]